MSRASQRSPAEVLLLTEGSRSRDHEIDPLPAAAHIDDAQATSQSSTNGTEKGSAGPNKPVKKHQRPRWEWKVEILFLLLSFAALIAIIVLLAFEDGTSLESWSFYFSLNTVVSVLGTISRASLASAVGSCLAQEKWNWYRKRQDHLYIFDRIDNASRGSLGSFKLLFWMRPHHWASLGAGVIVVLLAYDPFIQAVVETTGRLDEQHDAKNSVATIGSAASLDNGLLVSSEGGLAGTKYTAQTDGGKNTSCVIDVVAKWSGQPDLGMVASVYDGFYNQSTSTARTVAFTCSTGNCTWQPYTSLAVCGSCRDVTSHITMSSENATESSSSEMSESGLLTTFALPLNNISNWAEEYSMSASGKRASSSTGAQGFIGATSTTMSARGTINGSELLTFTNSTTFLFGFSVFNVDEGYLNGTVSWNESRPTATECGLELCTNIYNSSANEGSLQENVLHSSIDRNMSSLEPEQSVFISGDYSACSQSFTERNNYALFYGWPDSAFSIPRTDLRLLGPDSATRAGFNLSDSSQADFPISDRALKSMLSWVRDEFTGTDLVWYEDVSGDTSVNWYPDDSFWNQSSIASALTNQSELASTFGRVADSMTVWMRNLGFAEEPMAGTASLWVLHIQVRWPFLVLPIALNLAGCLFCLVIITQTRRLGLRPWRDSCMAVMAHGIGDELRSRMQHVDDLGRAARETQIAMGRGDEATMLMEKGGQTARFLQGGRRMSYDSLIVNE